MYGTLAEYKKDVPSRSTLIVWGEFLELTGTTPDRLSELMDIGWLKPTRTAEAALLFRQDDVYRIRKLERLCSDFELRIARRLHSNGPAGPYRNVRVAYS